VESLISASSCVDVKAVSACRAVVALCYNRVSWHWNCFDLLPMCIGNTHKNYIRRQSIGYSIINRHYVETKCWSNLIFKKIILKKYFKKLLKIRKSWVSKQLHRGPIEARNIHVIIGRWPCSFKCVARVGGPAPVQSKCYLALLRINTEQVSDF